MNIPHPTSPPAAGPKARYIRSSGPARAARVRRENAERQRLLRDRRRENGAPDPNALDRSIVDALRSILLRCPDSLSMPVDPALILSLTREHLLIRSIKARELDPDAPLLDGEAVSDALRRRLLEKPKRPVATR
ncbi:hypothetical protein [Methylobacterium sp. Leaf112]|uniref:hypothetical protein n=1 Tax=Methylobacterium sp. Leaf112 TaxID=1736258 RepID=UPI0006FAC09A|nr:hypothetical protein [Methylobacterium sp. Leaf112]KQP62149.1 hypothetical protein ASF52_05685 [Methylobacterium sp. Leaf112]